MGKLHTLRRAIKRSPENWYYISKNYSASSKFNKPRDFEWKFAFGVGGKNKNDGFFPTKYGMKYRGFVKSVLKEMGITELL